MIRYRLFLVTLLFCFAYLSVYSQPCFTGGTGVDGAYTATVNTTIAGGTYNFTTFNINAGVTVNVTGTQPLIINCTGAVTIDGVLSANGGNGVDGITYISGGTGGIAVAGGHDGGTGTFASGAGPLAGLAGNGPGATGNEGAGWSGGGGAGYASVGDSSGGVGGFGGPIYGDANLTVPDGGSGGGGGSGGYDCGAGGGGAGGGMITINSGVSITIGAAGLVSCNGGNGGSDGTGNCGGGGGGSGGIIFLASGTITNNGSVTCNGGIGGASNVPGTPYYGGGGSGSEGRIRIDHNTSLLGSGTYSPAIGSQNPVNAAPIFSIVASPNDTICSGNPLTLYGSGNAASYSWSGGITDSVAFMPTLTSYTVTATASGGCTSTGSITITVLATPTVGYSVSPNDTVCEGSNVTLSGSGAASYSWTGSITNATPFAPVGSASYTVTGTALNGCTNTSTANIIVHSLPDVGLTVTSNDTVLCNGESTTLTGTGAISYIWTGGITNGISFSPGATSPYTVTGTDANGCTNTATVNITVNSNPVVNLGADIVQANPPAMLDAGSGFSSYLWSTTETTQTISVSTNGNYIVTVTNAGGCEDSDTVNVTFTAGIDDPVTQNTLQLYPNPSDGVFSINIQNAGNGNFVLDVIDITGKIVYTEINNSANENFNKVIQLTELKNGIYFLRITSEKYSAQQRFIIKK